MALETSFRHLRSLVPDLAARAKQHVGDADIYRLDPLSHLDAGHVQIRDTVTKRPVIFTPYDHEVELIDSWVKVQGEGDEAVLRWFNVHTEKSRAMGITWTCAWVFLWALMYWPVSLLAQHVDLGRIDDGGNDSTHESLFGKIRFMAKAETWPEWMRPIDTLHFRQNPEHIITNRLNGAYLVGRGREDDPARGGQYDAYLGDEFARIEHAEQVQESLVSACPTGRHYNSTPFGEDNEYYELKKAKSAELIYLHFHWSIHPVYSEGLHVAGEDPECELCANNRKKIPWSAEHPISHRYPGKLTSPWYDTMVLRLLVDESIAQELDISYSRALSARVYREFSDEIHVLDHIAYTDALPIELSIDYGWSPSSTSIGIWQDAPDSLRKIGELEVFEHTPEDVVAALKLTLLELGVPETELGPQFTRQWLAIGDPSGEAAELGTGESLVVQYRKQGLEITSERYGVFETIIAYKRLLLGSPKPVRYSGDTCEATIKHLNNNRWPTDRHGKRKIGATAPLNDQHNHMTRADAYYISTKYPAPQLYEPVDEQSGFVMDDLLPYYRLSVAEAHGLDDRPELRSNMRL